MNTYIVTVRGLFAGAFDTKDAAHKVAVRKSDSDIIHVTENGRGVKVYGARWENGKYLGVGWL